MTPLISCFTPARPRTLSANNYLRDMKSFHLLASFLIITLCACSPPPGYEQSVKSQLVDPESVQFRNIYEGLNQKDGAYQKTGWTCGQFNAKNRMGGYNGFKRFAATKAGEATLEGDHLFEVTNKAAGCF